MLYSGLEYLGEPTELERLAAPFGGGMHMGDHCGYFCAALMVVGLATVGVPDGKRLCSTMQKSFTDAWKKKWPLRCQDIKKAQVTKAVTDGCSAIGRAAAGILGDLIKPLVDHPKRIRFGKRAPA